MSHTAYLRRRAAAEYLRGNRGIPTSEKTLAKLACIGGGPVYRPFGRIPLYLIADLDAYADAKLSKPVRRIWGPLMSRETAFPILLTPQEAAKLLKVSLSWLAKARMRGDGPPFMNVGRSIRYTETVLLHWIKSQQRLSKREQ
jgi:Helix-turn-helix domain